MAACRREVSVDVTRGACCAVRQVVHAIYDAKSEVIGPGEFRFKAEIGEPLPEPRLCLCRINAAPPEAGNLSLGAHV